MLANISEDLALLPLLVSRGQDLRPGSPGVFPRLRTLSLCRVPQLTRLEVALPGHPDVTYFPTENKVAAVQLAPESGRVALSDDSLSGFICGAWLFDALYDAEQTAECCEPRLDYG